MRHELAAGQLSGLLVKSSGQPFPPQAPARWASGRGAAHASAPIAGPERCVCLALTAVIARVYMRCVQSCWLATALPAPHGDSSM